MSANSNATISILEGSSNPANNESYSPSMLTTSIGIPIKWTNNDFTIHTVTHESPDSTSDVVPIFDSGILASGKSFEFTFNKPGTYDYYCTLHPFMKGQVVVLSTTNSVKLTSSSNISTSVDKSHENMRQEEINDSINMISFEIPKSWTSAKISGNMPNIKWNFDVFVAINEYTSASFIITNIPEFLGGIINNNNWTQMFSFLSPVLSPYSQYFTLNEIKPISFGNNYVGTMYLVSINDEQVEKIKSMLPLSIQKPADLIAVTIKQNSNYYLMIFSTDFYPESYGGYGGYKSQMNIYRDEFAKILESIRFEKVLDKNERSETETNNSDFHESNLPQITPIINTKFKEIEGIKILSENKFVDEYGDIHVVGEVQNIRPMTIESLKPRITLYDSDNRILGTEYTYANPETVKPNQTSVFNLKIYKGDIANGNVSSYKLTFD